MHYPFIVHFKRSNYPLTLQDKISGGTAFFADHYHLKIKRMEKYVDNHYWNDGITLCIMYSSYLIVRRHCALIEDPAELDMPCWLSKRKKKKKKGN